MKLQDAVFIMDRSGRFFSNRSWELYYNYKDFCEDILFAKPFPSESSARAFIESYRCYDIDGNTPMDLSIASIKIETK